MADENSWRPGDDTNVMLRKILNRLEASAGGGGGGGGGGAVTIADGADVAEGAKADSAVTNPASSASAIALLKGLLTNTAALTNVGGFSTSIKDTTAVSASPDYSIGDAVGGKRTIASAVRVSGGTAVLEDILLLDRSGVGPGFEIVIFDADPTAATITDNSAFAFSTDDLKVIARVTVNASDWITINSEKLAHLPNLGRLLKAASGTSLYAAIIATTTWNATATDNLQVIYKLLQD